LHLTKLRFGKGKSGSPDPHSGARNPCSNLTIDPLDMIGGYILRNAIMAALTLSPDKDKNCHLHLTLRSLVAFPPGKALNMALRCGIAAWGRSIEMPDGDLVQEQCSPVFGWVEC
jgi:hypothetical protein